MSLPSVPKTAPFQALPTARFVPGELYVLPAGYESVTDDVSIVTSPKLNILQYQFTGKFPIAPYSASIILSSNSFPEKVSFISHSTRATSFSSFPSKSKLSFEVSLPLSVINLSIRLIQ